MERVKRKSVVGLVFAVMVILVNVSVQFFNQEDIVLKKIGINFLLFFLVGYVVLGNLFSSKKAN